MCAAQRIIVADGLGERRRAVGSCGPDVVSLDVNREDCVAASGLSITEAADRLVVKI